ncbi:MAG: nucleotide exchange factor GrpE [Candidatus Sumerlaeia bacterium]
MSLPAWLLAYGLLLLETFVLAAILAPLTIPLARRAGYEAGGGGRHIHRGAMTTLGGLAVVGSFLIVVVGNAWGAWIFRDFLLERFPAVGRYAANIPSVSRQLGAILIGGLIMCILGLLDDRFNLGPRLKLAIMILATVPLLLADVRIHGFLPWPWLAAVVTVLWVVFLTNSFNFLDNMDGLSSGIAAIVCLAFMLISIFAGEWFIAGLYAALAGALLGFLAHNFYPARLFMGDNGSLFVGYMIGSLSILSTYYESGVPTSLPVLTPLIVLGVPIFDTLSVMWIRLREGRPLMEGDRNHFSHRLTDLGMSQRRAVTFIYIVTAAVALGAVPLRTVGGLGGLAIVAQVGLLFWVIHRIERWGKKNVIGGSKAVPGQNIDKSDHSVLTFDSACKRIEKPGMTGFIKRGGRWMKDMTINDNPLGGRRRIYRSRRLRLHPDRAALSEREVFLEKALETALRKLMNSKKIEKPVFDESQVRKLQDQAIRVQAEFENYRKRTLREKEDLKKSAASDFLNNILPALDSFDHAVSALEQDHDAEALAKGIEAIHGQMHSALESMGVERIDPTGEKFDPNHHDALAVVETDEKEENTVYDCFQAGYVMNGKLLRPAKVRIAKKAQ